MATEKFRDPRWVLIGGLLAWGVLAALSLRVGAASDTSPEILWGLRLPRIVMASAVGMGLSVAGVILQAMFTNPLCEPYTLGVSSGASLGAVAGAWIGLPLLFGGLTGSALIGALLFALVLYWVSLRVGNSRSSLLLTGVMLGFLGSSLLAVVMALSDANGVQGALFWLLGDLSRARIQGAEIALGLVILLSFATWTRWRSLDALLIGEEGALALGVDVQRERKIMLAFSSLLVAASVSGAGMIGFVGLMVPHFSRKLVGSLHRSLIPVSAVLGALTLIAADTFTRALSHPYELPVGVVTALVGAPAFLWVLLKNGAGE